jgi:hypothetical protein
MLITHLWTNHLETEGASSHIAHFSYYIIKHRVGGVEGKQSSKEGIYNRQT